MPVCCTLIPRKNTHRKHVKLCGATLIESVCFPICLSHTGSVFFITVVRHKNTCLHTRTNTHFPLFCSSVATLYLCRSPGISLSLRSSPSVGVAHTSCLCTCPTDSISPPKHAQRLTKAQAGRQAGRQAHRAACRINRAVSFSTENSTSHTSYTHGLRNYKNES